MKKYLLIIITILIALIIIGINIGNKNYFLNNYKKYFPEKLKNTLKETLFVYQNQLILKKTIEEQKIQAKRIKEQALLISFDTLIFKKRIAKDSKIKIFESGVTNIISRRGYLQDYNGVLYFITGTGKLYFGNLTDNKDIITMSSIKSNFAEIINFEYILETKSVVNHFLIDGEN